MSDVPAGLDGKAKLLGDSLAPSSFRFLSGSPVKGRVYLDRIESLGIKMESLGRGQAFWEKGLLPMRISPARGADKGRHGELRITGWLNFRGH